MYCFFSQLKRVKKILNSTIRGHAQTMWTIFWTFWPPSPSWTVLLNRLYIVVKWTFYFPPSPHGFPHGLCMTPSGQILSINNQKKNLEKNYKFCNLKENFVFRRNRKYLRIVCNFCPFKYTMDLIFNGKF